MGKFCRFHGLAFFAVSQESNPSWEQKGSDIIGEGNSDSFGSAISLSNDGMVVAIGAMNAETNDPSTIDTGHVRVYEWVGSAWVQRGGNIDGDFNADRSGSALSLSGDGSVVAIGAEGNDANGTNSGQCKVFVWDGTAWVQRGGDIIGNASDKLGSSISLSDDGTIVAIGANENDTTATNSGNVRVFMWTGTNWSQMGGDINGDSEWDAFGSSVSLNGDGRTLAIGAPYDKNSNGYYAGQIRIFVWDGTDWVQRGGDINGQTDYDYSGATSNSVALSFDGMIVAIASYNHNALAATATDEGDYYRGQVRVFGWMGSNWQQMGGDIDGEAENDYMESVAISSDGMVIAVGSPGNDDGGNGGGSVRLFTWDGANWVQVGADIDGKVANESVGLRVSLSSDGRIVAITGTGFGTPTGVARVYELNGATAPPQSTVVESSHNYAPNTNERWTVQFPGVTCYSLTMDPQSWTPESADQVVINAVTEVEGELQYTRVGKPLYKRRLIDFGTQQVTADFVSVRFESDGDKQAWGFRLTVNECEL